MFLLLSDARESEKEEMFNLFWESVSFENLANIWYLLYNF